MASASFSPLYAQLDKISLDVFGLKASSPDEAAARIDKLTEINSTVKELKERFRMLEDRKPPSRDTVKTVLRKWSDCQNEIDQLLLQISQYPDNGVVLPTRQEATAKHLRCQSVEQIGCKLQIYRFTLFLILGDPVETLQLSHILPGLQERENSLQEEIDKDLEILEKCQISVPVPPPPQTQQPPLRAPECLNVGDLWEPTPGLAAETRCDLCILRTSELQHKSWEVERALKEIKRLRENEATNLKKSGDFQNARQAFQALSDDAAKDLRQRDNHQELVKLQDEIVSCLIAEGKYLEAEERAKGLLKTKRHIFKDNDVPIMETYQQLAFIYRRLSMLRKAEEQYRALWYLYPERGFPKTSPWLPQYDLILQSGDELAHVLAEQNLRAGSEHVLRELWAARKTAFTPTNLRTLNTGLEVISMREPADVTKDLEEIWDAIAAHVTSGIALGCDFELGMCFFKHRRYIEAEMILQPLWSKKLQEGINPSASNDLELGFCFGQALYLQKDLKKYEEARVVLNTIWTAVTYFSSVNSKPAAVEVGQHLVSVLKRLKLWSDAQPVQKRVYEIMKDARDHGPDHLETLDAQYSVALITSHLASNPGNIEIATKMFGGVFDVCKTKMTEEGNPQKKEYLHRAVQCGLTYAEYLVEQKLNPQAVDILQKVWEIGPSGKEKPSVLLSGLLLGKTLVELNEYDRAIPIAEAVWRDRSILTEGKVSNLCEIGLMYGKALLGSEEPRTQANRAIRAEPPLRKAWEARSEDLEAESTRYEVGILIGKALYIQSKYDKAKAWLLDMKQSQQDVQTRSKKVAFQGLKISHMIGCCHWQLKELKEAKRTYEEEIQERKRLGDTPESLKALEEELEDLKRDMKKKDPKKPARRAIRS